MFDPPIEIPGSSEAQQREDDAYRRVYGRDTQIEGSRGWIQWKGTNVCIDLHCVCGHEDHFDGEFFYHYQCPKCGRKYAVGCNVKLIELTDGEAAWINFEPARLG